ncbi:hypothetical protein [Curvibacter sp. AEP1-3]|uniref:hypothetical protein n=1 Tax=Curvibacter sp. AEP1-3 TaxID=1844971 RepID=UPI000B3C97F1|nr:hypothetical protein [Curvibacter sp. AEP1-3]
MNTRTTHSSTFLEILRTIELDPFPQKELRAEQVELVFTAIRERRLLARRRELLQAHGQKPIYCTELQLLDRDYGNEVFFRNGYLAGLTAAIEALSTEAEAEAFSEAAAQIRKWRDSIWDGSHSEQDRTWSRAPAISVVLSK